YALAVLRLSLPAAESFQHELGDRPQRLEDTRTVQGVGGKLRHAAKIQGVGQLGGRENEIMRQGLLVVLNEQRHRARIDTMLGEVRVHVLKALHVFLELSRLAVSDEDNTVRAVENELPRGLVIDLAGDGVELEFRGETRDDPQVERQEIEEQ